MINSDNLIVFEGMTSISAIIRAYEERPDIARKIEYIVYDPKKVRDKHRQLSFLKAKSNELGFSLESADAKRIDELSDGKTHGGFLAFCSERRYQLLESVKIKSDGIYFVLDGIEDPYNFGYTLRSLYAAGVDGVVLSPRNWLTAAGVVARASAGCSELIDLYIEDTDKAVKLFKSKGYRVASAGIRDSIMLHTADLSAPILFIVGGEKRGISRSLLDSSDLCIRIGYGREFKGSLPTAEASAIIAFEAAKFNDRIK